MQLEKGKFPIFVTLFGIVTDVRPLQPPKAPFPILVTPLGIIVFLHPAINSLEAVLIIALQLFRESYTVFPLSTTIEVRLVQSQKA